MYEEWMRNGGWEEVVEDTKGFRTRAHINKKKAVKEKYKIRIRET